MKKIKYFLLVLFSITFCWGLVACGQDDAPLIELPVPQNLQMDGRTLIWDENENASYYVVYFDFVEYTTDSASFDLSECLFPYTYEIEVMAVGDAIRTGKSITMLPKKFCHTAMTRED